MALGGGRHGQGAVELAEAEERLHDVARRVPPRDGPHQPEAHGRRVDRRDALEGHHARVAGAVALVRRAPLAVGLQHRARREQRARGGGVAGDLGPPPRSSPSPR